MNTEILRRSVTKHLAVALVLGVFLAAARKAEVSLRTED